MSAPTHSAHAAPQGFIRRYVFSLDHKVIGIQYFCLALVAALMIVFPVSKLLHAPGVFFSPTRNQVDNPREKRHVAGWSAQYDNTKSDA
jgi:hypothetical protein